MNPQDNPHFTAYALGELSAEEARELHEMLAATPAAAHELEQIEAVTDALRHGAPIPQSRLTHEQRYAVLHPANMPRRVQPMMPRKAAQRPRQTFWPVMGNVLKAAAVVALSGGAFAAGWLFSPVVKDAATIAATPPQQTVKPKPEVEVVAPPPAPEKVTPMPQIVANVPAPATVSVVPVPAKVEPVKPAAPELKQEIAEVKVMPVVAPSPAVAAVPAPAAGPANFGFSMPEGRGSFASTTKQAVDQFSLRPGLIKPLPPKAKGGMFASPLPANAKNEIKPSRANELYIHSWKAEVAACPWNAAHRLLRLVIQVPADQPAVMSSDAAFSLQVSFDPVNVKQFRLLSERRLTAQELRSAGTHVLWYEFQPNGANDVVRDRQIAVVTLPNARFTSQAVGPFDSSKLQVIDRGYSLRNAREDFVFESAVVGFGLLMRGAEQTGSLNLNLVMDLMKQTKGAEAGGDRARFIRLVQDAQQVAGL